MRTGTHCAGAETTGDGYSVFVVIAIIATWRGRFEKYIRLTSSPTGNDLGSRTEEFRSTHSRRGQRVGLTPAIHVQAPARRPGSPAGEARGLGRRRRLRTERSVRTARRRTIPVHTWPTRELRPLQVRSSSRLQSSPGPVHKPTTLVALPRVPSIQQRVHSQKRSIPGPGRRRDSLAGRDVVDPARPRPGRFE